MRMHVRVLAHAQRRADHLHSARVRLVGSRWKQVTAEEWQGREQPPECRVKEKEEWGTCSVAGMTSVGEV